MRCSQRRREMPAWPGNSEREFPAASSAGRLSEPRPLTLRQRVACGDLPFASRTTWPMPSANPKGIAPSNPGLRGTSYPGSGQGGRANPNGVASCRPRPRRNPVEIEPQFATVSQGSSGLATLGFGSESLWDSERVWKMGRTDTSPYSADRRLAQNSCHISAPLR